MMISTILLVANLLFLYFKGHVIIGWLWFLLFYPLEILVYIIFGVSFFWILDKIFD